jgi:hypothetical protein
MSDHELAEGWVLPEQQGLILVHQQRAQRDQADPEADKAIDLNIIDSLVAFREEQQYGQQHAKLTRMRRAAKSTGVGKQVSTRPTTKSTRAVKKQVHQIGA